VEAGFPSGSILAPGAVVGGYRIESVAGRGGMGVVYRATQLALDRPVALKLLTPDLAQDNAFRERFQRESRLLASIDHPNVITVHEAGEHDGRLFIAMRFVVGTDLRELILRDGKVEPVRAARLLSQVASALDAAHARGLIHRDVKPANILIEEREGREHAYLSDFGLTKQVGSSSAAELTASGQWVGTVDYIAPEQVLGRRVDARADVYALGCVLYTALTGSVPFQRDSAIATVFAHVNDPPPSLREALPGISPELDAAIARALAKEPDDRFPSAGDLGRAALAAAEGAVPAQPERMVARGPAAPATVQAGEPAAEPPPPLAPARARRRALVAAGIALAAAAALAVVLVVALGGDSSSEKSEGDAVRARLSADSIALGAAGTGVAVGDDAAWVAAPEANFVVRIDPATGRPAGRVEVGDAVQRVAVGEGAVFATSSEGIVRIDPEARRITARTGDDVDLSSGAELAVGDGALFAAVGASGEILKLDPDSLRVITRAPVPSPGLSGPIALGAGSIWVASNSEKRGFVFRFDTSSLTPQPRIDLGRRRSAAAGIAFGEGGVWVADWETDTVHRLDPATNRVNRRVTVSSGISSDDIAVGGGAVWVASAEQRQVVRIDPARGRVVGQPTPATTSSESELAVGLRSAWITDPETEMLTRLEF
jgi:streptogramin lyase